MERRVIATEEAPAAIGPYNQAIVAQGFVYTAGQIPLVPGTKDLAGEDIVGQTHQVLRNLRAVLEAAGTTLDQVVKTTVYLTDMNDFAAMNEVYKRYFTADEPARATVAVKSLPMNSRVEIDAVAVKV